MCLLFGAGLVAILFTIRDIERKFVAPILHKLRDEGIIKLIQVDLDKNRPLGEKFGITAIPTLLFFKDGEMLEGTIEVQNQPLVQNGHRSTKSATCAKWSNGRCCWRACSQRNNITDGLN